MDLALVPPPESEDWEGLLRLVLDAVSSLHTKRAYSKALQDFLLWYEHTGQKGFRRANVQAYRSELEKLSLTASTINQRLSAIRKLAREAADNGLLEPHLADAICRVAGIPLSGRRTGQWLDKGQARELLALPDTTTIKGRRDLALLAVLIGCGLRRSEASALTWPHIQMVEGRWVILDLVGKRNRMRTVPMPSWTKVALDSWREGTGIEDGLVFRSLDKAGRMKGARLSAQAIWNIVSGYSIDLRLRFAPHDLRRTHAKLAYKGGAPVEQIQICLGHASLMTTQVYLGLEQDLHDAPCDRLGLG